MGFFYGDDKATAPKGRPSRRSIPKTVSKETLRASGCKLCPLRQEWPKLNTPKMEPAGDSWEPLFYVIGGQPTAKDDIAGAPFAGTDRASEYVLDKLPSFISKHAVYDNVVRCRTAGGDAPSETAINSCWGFNEASIEQHKPWAIIAFGSTPLIRFLGNGSQVALWQGRRIPVTVGEHTCLLYPMVDPITRLMAQRKNRDGDRMENEDDKLWTFHLERIVADYKECQDEAVVEPESAYYDGVICIYPEEKGAADRVVKQLEWFSRQPVVAVDYETQNLRPYAETSKLLTISLSTGKRTVAFPFDHPSRGWNKSDYSKIKLAYKKFLRGCPRKVAHNLEMEVEWTFHYYGDVCEPESWDDTMAMAYIQDERPGRLNLGHLTLQYFGFNVKELSTLDKRNMVNEPLEKVLPYNSTDAKYTKLLADILTEKLERPENRGLEWTHQHVIRLSTTLAHTQALGVVPNIKEADRLTQDLGEELAGIEAEIRELAEVRDFVKRKQKDLKPGSDQDVLYVLQNILDRDEVNITEKSGKPKQSTNEAVLRSIPEDETIFPALILEYREIQKLLSTYILPISQGKLVYEDGLIHASYNSKLTGTGRLSCEDPNLQNFPKRKHREVRRLIRALAGQLLVAADYGQIEARVIAMATQDKVFCDALWNDLDIHQDWADRLGDAAPYAVELVAERRNLTDDKEIAKQFRDKAKNGWVFPLFFGASLNSVAKYMSAEPKDVEDCFNEFWDTFKGVRKWQRKLVEFYNKHHYVECLTGRRRRFDTGAGALGYNEIINAPIQGTASDIVTRAMNRCDDAGYTACMNIHDDLTFPLDKSNWREDALAIAEIMCFTDFDFINVPIKIEMEKGPNWYKMKKVREFESNKEETWVPLSAAA